jgi:CheY-like chemotaxis protein
VAAETQGKLILVVDDERDLLDIVKFAVAKDGLKIEFARNGASALEKIPTLKPDLIVLDLMLPMISGLDILAQMKGSESAKTPVIVMTAVAAFAKPRQEAAKFPNVIAVLEKPVPMEKLREMILMGLSGVARPRDRDKTG